MSSSSTSSNQSLGPLDAEKLTRDNLILWIDQIMPAIQGAQLVDILEGTTKAPAKTLIDEKAKEFTSNPAYESWLAKDQQLLGYILNSLTKEVLTQVATMMSSTEVWVFLEGMFPLNLMHAQQICACILQAVRRVT
jgi:hypothetical protein